MTSSMGMATFQKGKGTVTQLARHLLAGAASSRRGALRSGTCFHAAGASQDTRGPARRPQRPRRLWERDSTVRGPSRLRRRGYSQDLTAEVPVLKAAVFTVGPSKASEFPSRRRGPALGRAKAFWLRPVVEAHAASKQSRSPTPTSDIRFRIRAPGVRAGVHHTSAGCIMARGGHTGGAGPACPAVSST